MLSPGGAFNPLICIKLGRPAAGAAAYPGSIREMINVSLAV